LPGSPASRTNIARGDVLRRINGNTISDVLDYKYATYDALLLIELAGANGGIKLVRIHKPEGADVGLEFETFLMDKERSCANKCIFCFIDQLPKGMRSTLYYKDDDVRLSFLQGNYITLTNLSKRDIERIIKLRISPINVSVHTLDPELRTYMLGTNNGAAGVNALRTLAGAGITLNCQIVCCPGINDGTKLGRTIEDLYALGPYINSVSVVPVGLTKHREGLPELQPFDRELAIKTVRQVDIFGENCLKKRGSRMFFCADELYMKAGMKLPPHIYYEDYPQLENGVGMMRLFITEFLEELGQFTIHNSQFTMKDTRYEAYRLTCSAKSDINNSVFDVQHSSFSIATGVSASKYLTKLLKIVSKKYGKIWCRVYAIRNDFFGDSVTVSGLITGGDIIDQLKGRKLGKKLVLPQNMLRHGDDVFLDDVTVTDVSEALGVPVEVIGRSGADLFHAILEG